MIIVNVTSDHIQKGVKNNPKNCPIQLALRNKFPSPHYRLYTYDNRITIWIGESLDYINFPTTAALQNWINRFDEGKPVAPFTLILL